MPFSGNEPTSKKGGQSLHTYHMQITQFTIETLSYYVSSLPVFIQRLQGFQHILTLLFPFFALADRASSLDLHSDTLLLFLLITKFDQCSSSRKWEASFLPASCSSLWLVSSLSLYRMHAWILATAIHTVKRRLQQAEAVAIKSNFLACPTLTK